MRQIIPFKKELLFKTRISEITSISLEHTLALGDDGLIRGQFYITGDYKMTEASINREKFYFDLPFEIDLSDNYEKNSVSIDIDNFYYEIVNDDAIQVNIDIFVDGKKVEEKAHNFFETIDCCDDIDGDKENSSDRGEEVVVEKFFDDSDIKVLDDISDEGDLDISDDNDVLRDQVDMDYIPSVDYDSIKNKVSDKEFININNDIDNFNNNDNNNDNSKEVSVFDNSVFVEESYATYYVYVVKEDDTLDYVLDKFSTTKEELLNYNDLSNIKKGMKLIIPSKNE